MKIDRAAVALSVMLASCSPALRRGRQDPGTAPKAAHVFGTYERSTRSAEAAIKGSIPDIDFAFEGAGGDTLIRFRSESNQSLFDGVWWTHGGALYQLDAATGGTWINGRYDDLVVEFWEPRMTRGRGVFSGNSDAVRLDCGTPERAAYRALSKPDIETVKERIRKGEFKIIALPEPGKERPNTPCAAFLERN